MNNRELAVRYAEHTAKHFGIAMKVGGENDDFVVEFDGWVMVEEAVIAVAHPYIGAKTEEIMAVPGFMLTEARTIPGSYWEPDDVDIVEAGEFRSLGEAIEAALMLVLGNIVRNALQSEAEALYYDEQAEMREYVG